MSMTSQNATQILSAQGIIDPALESPNSSNYFIEKNMDKHHKRRIMSKYAGMSPVILQSTGKNFSSAIE